MDLLEGLKYGAIGLCVILFIISTRLLSKEQNREEVRTPVLNMIKMFLGSAVFLSLFFGLTEFLSPESADAKLVSVINDIWSNHDNRTGSDSTLALKITRIKEPNKNPFNSNIDTSLTCTAISKELKKSKEELKRLNQNFYSNIAKLKKAIDQNGGTLNVDFEPKTKPKLYKTLEEIFIKLDVLKTPNNDNKVIRKKWKTTKKKWISDQHKFIFYSDVPQLVRQYLDKFHATKDK